MKWSAGPKTFNTPPVNGTMSSSTLLCALAACASAPAATAGQLAFSHVYGDGAPTPPLCCWQCSKRQPLAGAWCV